MAIFRSLLTFKKIPILSPSMEKATHSSVLAWEIPWTGEPGGLQSMGSRKESDTTERLKHHCIISLPSRLES